MPARRRGAIVLGLTATAEKSNDHSDSRTAAHTRRGQCIVTIDAWALRGRRPADSRARRPLRVVRKGQPSEAARLDPAGPRRRGTAARGGEHLRGALARRWREEVRRCWAFEVGERLDKAEQWRELRSFAVLERTRTIDGKSTVEQRHYISSLAPDVDQIAQAMRSHWEMENRLH
jgi:predicted transposase YbfD/YdcC